MSSTPDRRGREGELKTKPAISTISAVGRAGRVAGGRTDDGRTRSDEDPRRTPKDQDAPRM